MPEVAPTPQTPPPPELIDKDEVAALLGCSPKHVERLVERKKIPPPIRLGALVKFRRARIMEWIAADCPAIGGAR